VNAGGDAWHRLGAVGLRDRLRLARGGAAEAVEACLARIAELDGTIGAFTHVDTAGARAEAADSDRRLAAGLGRALEGVPVALKANIDVAGWPVTAGIGAWRARVPDADAEVVRRLRAAGAVLIGATNMHEAALGATTDNHFYGRTHNPHRHGYTPGGSSGGSGAAVAAGLAAAALGTDTLGSIRLPAAYCGVTGLKPSPGLVADAGLVQLVGQWDVIGPIARSVADVALLMSAIAEGAAAPPISRVVIPSSIEAVEMHASVRAAQRTARDLLRGLGVEVGVGRVTLDHHRVRLAGFVVASREAKARFGAEMERAPEGFSPAFHELLAFGARFDAAAVATAEATLKEARAAMHALLQAADAILMPTAPQPAFAFDGPHPVSQADFTALANIAGLPALSLPAGWTSDGLPVAVQLLGRPGADGALLALGGRLEAALNALRWPQDRNP
jgi:aspartyl-tRNA(Asn)/glutamyl-tRNA(Gln) amidotransferase subunit A